jgi:hypothetical protein
MRIAVDDALLPLPRSPAPEPAAKTLTALVRKSSLLQDSLRQCRLEDQDASRSWGAVEPTEGERLIRALNDDGGPAALEAATTIGHAYVKDHFSATLTFDTREAIAFVLAWEDDLTEGLQHLRERLSRHVVALLKIM